MKKLCFLTLGCLIDHFVLLRAGLINTYTLGWLRPEENHLLAIPREIADSYPEHIRRLMGYQASGSLGLYPGDPDETWERS